MRALEALGWGEIHIQALAGGSSMRSEKDPGVKKVRRGLYSPALDGGAQRGKRILEQPLSQQTRVVISCWFSKISLSEDWHGLAPQRATRRRVRDILIPPPTA